MLVSTQKHTLLIGLACASILEFSSILLTVQANLYASITCVHVLKNINMIMHGTKPQTFLLRKKFQFKLIILHDEHVIN